MKEHSVLGVLMYIFKHHMQQNCEIDAEEENLLPSLEQIGFKRNTIIQALSWLGNLTQVSHNKPNEPRDKSFRIYSEYECEYLDLHCQSYILQLEQQGVLNAVTREIVISQVIELENEGIDVNLIKWVTLMVLFNQTNDDQALAYMEFLVLNGNDDGSIH